MNPENFAKMAHGDPDWLMEMSFDYFNETRHLMTGWRALIECGDFAHLRDDLHRCKGGASLFGLERLVAMLGDFERPDVLEQRGFDIEMFEQELTAAENAVMAMAQGTCC